MCEYNEEAKLKTHRMFTKDGELVATCVQEVSDKYKQKHDSKADRSMQGVVRLKEGNGNSSKSKSESKQEVASKL